MKKGTSSPTLPFLIFFFHTYHSFIKAFKFQDSFDRDLFTYWHPGNKGNIFHQSLNQRFGSVLFKMLDQDHLNTDPTESECSTSKSIAIFLC